MRFEHPNLLLLLLLAIPVLTGFFWWAWKAKQRLIAQFVQSRLLANLTVGVSAQRQKLRMALIVLSAALLVMVLARPQWGFTWEEAKQRGLDVVVALDTSRSMLALDVAPNRLERAKLAALDLKKIARTDRVGLVAFAGTAFLQCPLSFDDEAFRQSLNALDVNIIPQGGTALAEAIQTALGAFKEKSDNHKILLIFSDGEDHDGNALEAAKEAAKEGMRIFTIGVGTANGELLRVTEKGKSDYVRDSDGNVVKSHLNEQLLRQVAEAGNGFYMLLTGANTIDVLYERGLAPLPKAEKSAPRIKRYHERYQWLLGLVIVLLIVEMFLPDRKRVVRSEAIASASNPELRKAIGMLLLLMLPAGLWAASPSSALKKYEKGQYDRSFYEYQKLLKEKPKDPRLHFNTGAAAYKAKDYEQAQKELNAALFTDDLQLQQRAYYNLGNTHFRMGEEVQDPQKRQEFWEQALLSYTNALALKTNDIDAKFNISVVQQKLEELKKQQEQQKQNQQNKDDKKDDQKDQQKQDQQKQDEQQKQDQQKQDQQQQKPEDSEKKDQQEQQAKQDQGDKKEDQKDQQQSGQPQKIFQMTPQEAERLLDTIKNDERTMIFIPQLKTNRQNRVFKNW